MWVWEIKLEKQGGTSESVAGVWMFYNYKLIGCVFERLSKA